MCLKLQWSINYRSHIEKQSNISPRSHVVTLRKIQYKIKVTYVIQISSGQAICTDRLSNCVYINVTVHISK